MALRNVPLKWSKKHRLRLQKAAGVAKVDLLCTALTWQLLHAQAIARWSTVTFPGVAKDTPQNELVRISLTGPQLAQLMERTLWGTLPGGALTPGHRALYQRAYDAAVSVIDDINLAVTDGVTVPDIVIDARIATD